MIKVKYSHPLSNKSQRFIEQPHKYTIRGEVRAAWKKSVAQCIARATKRVQDLQTRIDSGDDYMPRSEFMSDAYGDAWELIYHNASGTISGVLIEEY